MYRPLNPLAPSRGEFHIWDSLFYTLSFFIKMILFVNIFLNICFILFSFAGDDDGELFCSHYFSVAIHLYYFMYWSFMFCGCMLPSVPYAYDGMFLFCADLQNY